MTEKFRINIDNFLPRAVLPHLGHEGRMSHHLFFGLVVAGHLLKNLGAMPRTLVQFFSPTC